MKEFSEKDILYLQSLLNDIDFFNIQRVIVTLAEMKMIYNRTIGYEDSRDLSKSQNDVSALLRVSKILNNIKSYKN